MARKTKHIRRKNSQTSLALRIIGGHFRGRKLKYSGDPSVRPMKDRVREALFNLLGPAIKETHAVDLFGGTGALGLEALSRGAISATIIEKHLATSKIIAENVATLELEERVTLISGNAFHWWDSSPALPKERWAVFVSPPYRYFVEQRDTLLDLVRSVVERAPLGSLISVEATKEFDFDVLVRASEWDVRSYPPAVVGVLLV